MLTYKKLLRVRYMGNKFNVPSSYSPEGKREYQKLHIREKRAKEKGFNSYAEFVKTKKPNATDKKIAYLESEVERLKYELEVALCSKL